MINFDINVNTPSLQNTNRFHQKIIDAVNRITIKLTNYIKSDKLTGQVLKVRTGRLRNSIHSKVEVNNNLITGKVQTNVKYAKVHEYGFSGNVTIRAHLRNIKQAFGKQIAPKTIQIGSYTRKAIFPQRSFLRSALSDMKAEIKQEIRQALKG